MLKGLVIIHALAAVVWLGGAAYEKLFLVPEIRRAQGTSLELPLLRLVLRPERTIAAVAAVLVVTGVLMTLAKGGGFFQVLWLGLKQAVIILILLGYVAAVGPELRALRADVERAFRSGRKADGSLRRRFRRLLSHLDLIHAGVLLNLILAFWKPT